MARKSRHHYRREEQQAELDITTFLNLMVVLIPFLLVTAVFSRITIQELHLPTEAAGGAKLERPQISVEVIVRKGLIQLSDGDKITSTIRNVENHYNIKELSRQLQSLKDKNQEVKEATLLVEPDIEYETLIHIMDAVKVAEVKKQDGDEGIDRVVLFPQISVGDAP
ncbi:MAG: biopolymer transporter ExbD [Gammaproteobacteria bacterium]|nr:biopolymer transporter ExbD [Gammaproteobacteria bacterium]MBU1481523.1 biopolymer transporter ExbD [Gammaproteobacteria bacterium]